MTVGRKLSASLASIVVAASPLALVGSYAGATLAPRPQAQLQPGASSATRDSRLSTCFANLAGDDLDVISSQNFEQGYDIYDAVGADDFTLTAPCNIRMVQVVGHYYNNPGPPPVATENVTIYRNQHAQPGRIIDAQTVDATDDGSGSFRIHLSTVRLAPGTYWLSVQLNLNYTAYGQWGWDNTTNGVGHAALWQNPGDGFETGCLTWSAAQTCLDAPGPDFVFAILGRSATT